MYHVHPIDRYNIVHITPNTNEGGVALIDLPAFYNVGHTRLVKALEMNGINKTIISPLILFVVLFDKNFYLSIDK